MAAPGVSHPSSGGPSTRRKSKSLWKRLTKKNGQAAGKTAGKTAGKKTSASSSSGSRKSSSSGGGGRPSAPKSSAPKETTPPSAAGGGQTTPRAGRSAGKGSTPETAATVVSLTPGSGGVELPEPLFPAFQGDGGEGAGGGAAGDPPSPDLAAPGLSPSRRSGHRPPDRAQAGAAGQGQAQSPPTPSRFGLSTPTKSHHGGHHHGVHVHSASKSLASGLREQPTLSTASMTATHGERSWGQLGGDAAGGRAQQSHRPPAEAVGSVTPRSRSGRTATGGAPHTPGSGERWTPLRDGGWSGDRARTLPAVGSGVLPPSIDRNVSDTTVLNISDTTVLELDYHDKTDERPAASPPAPSRGLSPVVEEIPALAAQPSSDPPTRKATSRSRLGALKGKGKRGKSKSSDGSGSRSTAAQVSAQQESHEGSGVRSPQQQDDQQRRQQEPAKATPSSTNPTSPGTDHPPRDAPGGGRGDAGGPDRRHAPPQQPHLYAEICIPPRRSASVPSGGAAGRGDQGAGGGGAAQSGGKDDEASLAATSISSLTGRSSLFAPVEYATSAWCNGDEERGTPIEEVAGTGGGDARPGAAAGGGAGADYFDYSPDERGGSGVGGGRDGRRARPSPSSFPPPSRDDGLASRLGRCFGGWEAVRAVTCRCFDLGSDDPLFGDAAAGRQSETKSLGRSLALSSGGVTVDTEKETAGTASGEAGTRSQALWRRNNRSVPASTVSRHGSRASGAPTFSEPLEMEKL